MKAELISPSRGQVHTATRYDTKTIKNTVKDIRTDNTDIKNTWLEQYHEALLKLLWILREYIFLRHDPGRERLETEQYNLQHGWWSLNKRTTWSWSVSPLWSALLLMWRIWENNTLAMGTTSNPDDTFPGCGDKEDRPLHRHHWWELRGLYELHLIWQ